MAYYNLKIPVNCASEQEASALQKDVANFRLLDARMVAGLMQLQKKNPALIKSVLSAAASGNIGGAISGIMKAM